MIWVEPPGGDPYRNELAREYSVFNRAKRSIVVDLDDEAGRDRLESLLATADVFVESWRPGVAEKFGLGRDALHERFPHLVTCSISGFGPDGPHRDTPGYEAIVQAIVGTMAEQVGFREGPIYQGVPFASIGAAYLAVVGVMSALLGRAGDGVGRHVDTSLFDGALSYHTMLWGDADTPMPPRDPGSSRLVAKTVMCADGEYLGVHTGALGAFGRLMKELGIDDQVPSSESGLDMGIPLTPEQRHVLDVDLHDIFATEPRSVWVERLVAADICAIPLLAPVEVFDQPQTIHNEMVIEVDDPVLGRIQQVAPPAKFRATPAEITTHAPIPGEHDGEIAASDRRSLPLPDADPSATERPLLDGLKVLDIGAYFAGPFASRLLADLGANVIKLEPLRGDQQRGLEHVFRGAQAGKRSIAVDLKQPEGQAIAADLVRWTDVVHHNMRPGAAERLGMGEAQVRELNPRIVYGYAPGWGSSGPNSHEQSFAPQMSGYVGAMHEVAGEYNPPLWPCGNEDPGNGMLGAVAMLMALWHRASGGEGQYVENPQLNAALTHVEHIVRRPDGETLGALQLDPVQLGHGALDRLYETADGWLCIVVGNDVEFASLVEVLALDLDGDERFATAAAREQHAGALEAMLMAAFAARTNDDVVPALQAAGVPCAVPVPHNNVAFMTDPENRRTGRVAECPHETRGRVRELAVLVRVSDALTRPHRLAPGLGEHTDEILGELGRSPEEIERLRAAHVVG